MPTTINIYHREKVRHVDMHLAYFTGGINVLVLLEKTEKVEAYNRKFGEKFHIVVIEEDILHRDLCVTCTKEILAVY